MIESILQAIYNNYQAKVLVALVAANFLVAVYGAVRSGTFSLRRVGDVVNLQLVPYLVAYGTVSLLAWAMPDLSVIREIAWIALVASGVGTVLRNVKEWGVPVESN